MPEEISSLVEKTAFDTEEAVGKVFGSNVYFFIDRNVPEWQALWDHDLPVINALDARLS